MKIEDQYKLKFFGVDIIHVEFKSRKPIDNSESEINLDVDVKIFYPESEKDEFKILMNVGVDCFETYTLKLTAVGNFEVRLNEEKESNLRSGLLQRNATAIMFPYVRSFISTFTSNVGNSASTLIIPAKFFKGELEEIKFDSSLENDELDAIEE